MNKPSNEIAIMWFRQDLRLSDNPALSKAVEEGKTILPIYILDDDNADEWRIGAASRWWLHHSLTSLNQSMDGALQVFKGRAEDILADLIEKTGASSVYWNRCYEPWRIKRDTNVKASLQDKDVEVESFNGSLLFEPHTVLKDDGTPYKVFTPFYRKGCLQRSNPPRQPITAPDQVSYYEGNNFGSTIDDLNLLPSISWDKGMVKAWEIGEQGAQKRLREFLDEGIDGYKEGRDFPNRANVSRLSPYLHFGEISPHQIWYVVDSPETKDADHFLSELGWREFSHYLLYHFPKITRENLQAKFDKFPWRDDKDALKAWQKGQTGIPMVDAGMRELWQTGYMHNRVRMIVGSFLVKNLLLHWHHGEDWFWDTLVDADLANNSASWQWIAGCGADAAPYFRIFNCVTQGQKFDPEGEYVRRYVPELANLPDKYIHAPWEAPEMILLGAGVKLGTDYPKSIVDLKASRERALEAFQGLKTA